MIFCARFEGILLLILKIGLVLLVTRDVRNICRKNCAIDLNLGKNKHETV